MVRKFSKQVLAIVMSVFLAVILVPKTAVANDNWDEEEGVIIIDKDDYDPASQTLKDVVSAKANGDLSSVYIIVIEGVAGLKEADLNFLADSTKLPSLDYLDLSQSSSENTTWDSWFAGPSQVVALLALPNNITEISSQGFKDNTSLEYVKLPKTLTKIGEEAFCGCTNLYLVDFEGLTNLDTIESRAFASCGIIEAFLGDTIIASVAAEAFLDCPELEWVELPQTLVSISEKAFSGCPLLTELTLRNSSGVATFQEDAFLNSPNLEILYVPKALIDNYEASAWTDPSRGGFAALTLLPLEGHWIWILEDDEDMVFTVSPTYALPGEIIEIEVEVRNNDIMFHSWFDYDDQLVFEDKYATKTTFVMPDDDVDLGAEFLFTPVIAGVPDEVFTGDSFEVEIVYPYLEDEYIDEDDDYEDNEDQDNEGGECVAVFLSLDDVESTAIVEKGGWVWDDSFLSLAVDPLEDAAHITTLKSGTTDLVWSWDVDGVVISASETITIQEKDPALDPGLDDVEERKKPGRLAQTSDESPIVITTAFVVVAGATLLLLRKRFAR